MKSSKTLAAVLLVSAAFTWTPAHADSSMDVGDQSGQQVDVSTDTGDATLTTDSADTNCDGSSSTASRC